MFKSIIIFNANTADIIADAGLGDMTPYEANERLITIVRAMWDKWLHGTTTGDKRALDVLGRAADKLVAIATRGKGVDAYTDFKWSLWEYEMGMDA